MIKTLNTGVAVGLVIVALTASACREPRPAVSVPVPTVMPSSLPLPPVVNSIPIGAQLYRGEPVQDPDYCFFSCPPEIIIRPDSDGGYSLEPGAP